MSLLLLYGLSLLTLTLYTAYCKQKKINDDLSIKNKELSIDNVKLLNKQSPRLDEITYIKLKLKEYETKIKQLEKP